MATHPEQETWVATRPEQEPWVATRQEPWVATRPEEEPWVATRPIRSMTVHGMYLGSWPLGLHPAEPSARHNDVGLIAEDLRLAIDRHATSVVVHCRHPGRGLLDHVEICDDLCCHGDAREAFDERLRLQVLEAPVDVILGGAGAARRQETERDVGLVAEICGFQLIGVPLML